MKAEPQGQPTSINMELGEKEAEGIYSNFVVISHSLSEFVMDFARILPGNLILLFSSSWSASVPACS